MSEFQLLVWRKRRLLVRVAAVLAIGAGGLLAVTLPKADASDRARPAADVQASLLLSPDRVSTDRFMAAYALAYR